MSKVKTAYFCQNCGYESTKWLGKCPGCQQWNSFVEELIQKETKKSAANDWSSYIDNRDTTKRTRHLAEVESKETPRLLTNDAELNRVLGGGIVPGSIVLVAGEPGIGKSTLFSNGFAETGTVHALHQWRESEQQIKMRADR
jgi:DNA repair protein RadA/Sms